jgi:hypothetical protein
MADGKDYRTARGKVRVPICYAFRSPNSYQALARDGYRCLLTGTFDWTSMKKNRQLSEERARLGIGVGPVEACHILSESTMQGVDSTGVNDDVHVMNKVCAVNFSSLPVPPPHPLTTNDLDASRHKCHVPS